MNLLRLAGAAPVRYALVFALSSSVVMALLLGVIYGRVSELLLRQLDEGIEAQLQVLRSALKQDGRESMIGLVQQHQENYRDSPLHLLVQDISGRVLAGDLPPTEIGEGWHDIAMMKSGQNSDQTGAILRGRGEWLNEDLFVLVTNDTHDLRETRRLIVGAFAIALAATVVLALAGGLVIGRLLLRRVEVVQQTAEAIMEGDLSQRIPVIGPRDEFDGLADVLNRMLGRIEELMANLQHVTSDIAHDLRSPLGRLRQRLESARIRHSTGPEYEAVIDAAIAEADSMLKTFEAMLRIAQIEAGVRRARFTTLNMSEVADNVVDAFAAVAEDDGKVLEAEVEPAVHAHGDRELLTQMLANLVENAIRHTPRGTTLTVRLERDAGRGRLEVNDDGPGIPAEERERVFGRFYRLDQSRTTPGSGLGLALVGAVVRLHGWTITLEDNSPGLSACIELDAESS